MVQLAGIETRIGGYHTIRLDSLRVDSIPDFDLYIDNGTALVLYRSAKLQFTEKTRSALMENGVSVLYVSADDRHRYQRYVEANINEIINDPSIDEIVKAGIIYDSAKLLVKDVLDNPTRGENIKRCQSMVESTVSLILRRRDAFRTLLHVMSIDYHVYTHSVNVCTYSLALARSIDIKSSMDLNHLGTGAILHDIGKSRIPESILKKPTTLTESEMETIRKHPQWGFELIKETDLISDESCAPIIQHHERENGSGYPSGINSDYIHRYSKIVAIADVFDAMTTERAYRSAEDTFPVLKWMFSEKQQFDGTMLEEFAKLMGPSMHAR